MSDREAIPTCFWCGQEFPTEDALKDHQAAAYSLVDGIFSNEGRPAGMVPPHTGEKP